jgi:predicted amidohydrolase
MQDLKISLVQSDIVWEDINQNLQNFSELMDGIIQQQDLIILPEMFSTGFTMNVDRCAQSMNGPSIQWLNETANQKNAAIAGSILIKENDKYFNRMIWMKPDGEFEFYDKRHLFRMGKEHKTMSHGLVQKFIDYKGWRFNLQICYDLRFPVWSKNRFRDNQYDYDVLVYVANWPEVRSYAYKSLIIARAIENQAYVIWVNRIGKDGNGIKHSGDSMIIDPTGNVICQANPCKEAILASDLSSQMLLDVRSKFKVGLDWDKYEVR